MAEGEAVMLAAASLAVVGHPEERTSDEVDSEIGG